MADRQDVGPGSVEGRDAQGTGAGFHDPDEPDGPVPSPGDGLTGFRRLPTSVWIGAICLAIVALVVVLAGGDDPSAGTSEQGSLTAEEGSEARSGDEDAGGGVLADLFDRENRPDVPEVDCSSLLTDDEIVSALGGDADLVEEIEGEKCTNRLGDAPGYFVTIEPGTPSHLGAGERVPSVGDEAFWSPSRNLGTMTILDETPVGFLIFRITVGRPDMESSAIRSVTRDLALAALPRFTDSAIGGTEDETAPATTDPETVAFAPQGDPAVVQSYLDNLVVRENRGDWSLGEGLVATLRTFVGEIDSNEVLVSPQLADHSIDSILELASDHLQSAPDADHAPEIRRLLASLSFSSRVLEEATQAEDPSASARHLWVAAGMDFHEDETADEFCQKMFGVDAPCLLSWYPPPPEENPSDGGSSDQEAGEAPQSPEYVVYQPTNGAGGWTDQHAEWALEAMVESGDLYESLGDMPSANLTLWPHHDNHTSLGADGGPCSVSIGAIAREPIVPGGAVKGPFQQTIAARMAHCMLLNEGTASEWWGQSMPIYLSGVVYPQVDREHLISPFLSANELISPLLERLWSNWVFWERLHPTHGAEGNLAFASGSLSEIAKEFHLMSEALTDVSILDIGGGVVPYDPPSRPLDITNPIVASVRPGYFGVQRLQATVAPGRVACDIHYGPAAGVTASWREGTPADGGGSWSRQLPDELTGRAVFVVTGPAAEAELSIEIPRIESEEDGCVRDEQPEDEEPGSGPTICGVCTSVFFWNALDG